MVDAWDDGSVEHAPQMVEEAAGVVAVPKAGFAASGGGALHHGAGGGVEQEVGDREVHGGAAGDAATAASSRAEFEEIAVCGEDTSGEGAREFD